MIYQREAKLAFISSCLALLTGIPLQVTAFFPSQTQNLSAQFCEAPVPKILRPAVFGKRPRASEQSPLFSSIGANQYGTIRSRNINSTTKPGSKDLTSSMISHLAEVALQLRLHSHAGVSCDVTADPSRFVTTGSIGPVTVRGKSWESSLGLTCRAIEATVETCTLDFGRVVRDRKLRLTAPAKGNALIALNNSDFGNFLTHPFFKLQVPSSNQGKSLELLKENVTIDGKSGVVKFFGRLDGELFDCSLSRSANNGAQVFVDGSDSVLSNDLAIKLTAFFNNLVFELDGTFLKFKDMMITTPKSEHTNATLMLALTITVHKFPSAGAAF